MANRIFSSERVGRTQVESQKCLPISEVVEIAREIWTEICGSGVSPSDDAGNDALYQRLHKERSDFSASYPLILKWMVKAREFKEKVFRDYLNKFGRETVHKDRRTFLEVQGEYLVLLYKDRNPRFGAREVGEYRKAIRKQLEDEDKEFAKKAEEAQELVKELDALADQERRKRMYESLVAQKAQ